MPPGTSLCHTAPRVTCTLGSQPAYGSSDPLLSRCSVSSLFSSLRIVFFFLYYSSHNYIFTLWLHPLSLLLLFLYTTYTHRYNNSHSNLQHNTTSTTTTTTTTTTTATMLSPTDVRDDSLHQLDRFRRHVPPSRSAGYSVRHQSGRAPVACGRCTTRKK